MGRDDPRPDVLATQQFDSACQLVRAERPVGPRRFAGDQEIAARLTEMMGKAVSRKAVGYWRSGRTQVPGWALVGVFQLAGISVIVQMPDEIEAAERLARAASVA